MTNTTIQEITLDIGRSNIPIQSVPAKQYDLASRFLKVRFTDKGEPIVPAANSVVVINAERPDREAPTEPEPFFEGKRYYNGDRITFEGKIYVCQNVPDGQCCVWSPSAYPNYWTLE